MTSTSPAQCQFCANHYLSYRCLLLPAGALVDAANAGVEDDASIAAAAEFVFLQRDRLTVANEIMHWHPAPPSDCDMVVTNPRDTARSAMTARPVW